MATLKYGASKSNTGNWWSQVKQRVQNIAQNVSRNYQQAQRNAAQQRQTYAQNIQRYYAPASQGGTRQTKLTNPQPNVRNYQQSASMGQALAQVQRQQAEQQARARAQASTATNWLQSFRANYPEFSLPTKTTMPDTYSGQALRYSQQRYAQYPSEFRLLPDTYAGQGKNLSDQLTMTGGGASTNGGSSHSGYGKGGGYGGGGYGYGGWTPSWDGGGGNYEPPKPEYWLQLVSWNINRPEGA